MMHGRNNGKKLMAVSGTLVTISAQAVPTTQGIYVDLLG
jgi:hypothetical protein